MPSMSGVRVLPRRAIRRQARSMARVARRGGVAGFVPKMACRRPWMSVVSSLFHAASVGPLMTGMRPGSATACPGCGREQAVSARTVR
ncbi:MAG: hypothetical protein HZB91_03115 [Elusimicrobia bacterium]|nr:hypothetical protein [Elusimicrobiota bacterium]